MKSLELTKDWKPSEKFESILSKMTEYSTLPTFKEARQIWKYLSVKNDEDFNHLSWGELLSRAKILNVHTYELINGLARVIEQIGEQPIIEICAGDARLSYHLQNRGVQIKPIDDNSYNLSKGKTEILSHADALKKYNPKIVLGCWVHPEEQIGFDVLDFPSVNHFIDIGEGIGGATWMTNKIYTKRDFKIKELEDLSKYCLNRMDRPPRQSTRITWFRRKF
ncbi:hypothetical protein J4408_03400 [Candidatus Pacearchaeota archaeon]|nr:hypothetical protein [Candidatus Pacearchaeota archaeon]